MFNVLLSVISFFVFIKAMQELHLLIQSIPFSGLKRKKEESGVEVPEQTPIRARYDVEAFRRRMEVLKDEDGLYDVIESEPVTDFTGAEIITLDAELDIDKYARR